MEAQREKMAEGRDLFSGSSRRPLEAGRTPFDGLRAWAAMTHGVGIFLALVGTIFLLLKAWHVHSGIQAVGGNRVFAYVNRVIYREHALS